MISALIINLLKLRSVRTAIYISLAVTLGAILHARLASPKTTTTVVDHTTTVTVEKPVLTEKIVNKIINDPKDKAAIASLVAKNNGLGAEVTALNKTIASLTSTGGGPVVPITSPKGIVSYTFHDWQLDFALTQLDTTPTAAYKLNQQFEILSTTGRKKDGSKVAVVDVFQLGVSGERIPVPSKTTSIFADESTPRWMISPRVQLGVGAMTEKSKGGVVAFQWLKHGKSTDPKEIRWSVLSPAAFITQSSHDFGVLPVSVNLGSLPNQPFSNVWVSPFISRTRVGAALTATF